MLALFLSLCALSQDPAATQDPTLDQVLAEYEKRGIHWQKGPCVGDLGPQAQVQVPEGCFFSGGAGARALLESWQNPTNGDELGVVWSLSLEDELQWHVFFTFRGDGYVKDDEKEIDADALLASMKESNVAGNEERQKRGWPSITLLGWQKPPFYDPKTNNLTWATLLQGDKSRSVNWSTRMLGRAGVMEVDLVLGPEELDAALPGFEALLSGYEFKSGHKYAEFKAGDKIAEYGLAALVAGGAGALALKTGLFAKFWKFLIIPLLAAGAWLKKLFTGSKKPNEDIAGPGA